MRENKVCESAGIMYRPFKETVVWRPLHSSSALVVFFFLLLCAGIMLFAVRFFDQSTVFHSVSGKSPQKSILDAIGFKSNNYTSTSANRSSSPDAFQKPQIVLKEIIPLNCSFDNTLSDATTCPAGSSSSSSYTWYEELLAASSSTPQRQTCPDYFRWLYEDLRPWIKTGISEEMVMSAKTTAHFRLAIVNGTAYVEKYKKAFQTRDTFNLWGILQLLRRYPGKVPDLDLMFDCEDKPAIEARHFVAAGGSSSSSPPPLFTYCASDDTLDIPFPDWSFWGWPEINIKPWEGLSKDLKQANEKMSWVKREPYAYWKGNPHVDGSRMNLLTCNVSEKEDWGARLYTQDWIEEGKSGYKQSNLASQCTHRYKIYIEGRAWSVSEKYILACDSMTLLVKPRYHDFFSRGLVPMKHYWPIKKDDKCRSIKHAVKWGSNHQQQAQEVGKQGSKFIEEELKMEYVYDYMFHLLTQYAKLLNYKPSVPAGAVEVCSEALVCHAKGLEKQFMMESLVKTPSQTLPCSMPPPFDPPTLRSLLLTKQNSINQVESWENHYWERQIKHHNHN